MGACGKYVNINPLTVIGPLFGPAHSADVTDVNEFCSQSKIEK